MADFAVKLNKKRYDSKIQLHSQYVRWLRATPCYCVDQAGSVDPQCPSCLGRGFVYSHQSEMDVFAEDSPHCNSMIWPLNTPITKVTSVFRGACYNRKYTVLNVYSDSIEIGPSSEIQSLPNKDQQIKVNYTYSAEKRLGHVSGAYIGGGIVQIALPSVKTTDVDEIIGDITKVIEIKNLTQNIIYSAKSFFKNELYIDITTNEPETTDQFDITVNYINPFSFMLSQISERMRFEDAFIATEGEASVTVGYNIYLGNGDIISQCIGEQRGSAVLQMPFNSICELPAFDVTQILTIEDGTENEYVYGVDYVIKQGNLLVWLTLNKPTSKYSVTFLYHPSFKVFGVKPTVRTAENLKLPRRASLVSFDKVNKTEDMHNMIVNKGAL